MTRQSVIEDGTERDLKGFAKYAVKYLRDNPDEEEVVMLANHITELKNDFLTKPENIYSLPAGFQYYFSGFSGQVIGVGRTGIVH